MVNEMRVIVGRRALSITSARLLVIFQKLKALMRVDWRAGLSFIYFFVAVRWESMEWPDSALSHCNSLVDISLGKYSGLNNTRVEPMHTALRL